MSPRLWLHRGTLYLAGVPDSSDLQFSNRLLSAVGAADYHGRHRRWVISLSREAVAGLTALGYQLPPECRDWEREQERLEVKRGQANKLKTAATDQIRELLTKSRVWFRPELMAHQLLGAAYAMLLPAAALLMDTGTGKTATMATVMQAFKDRLGFRRMLVVAPRSILDVSWGEDIDDWARDLKWVNISSPPRRPDVCVCPVCGREFKRHVQWRHMRTHMAKAIARMGEDTAQAELYRRYPELFPPAQDHKRERLLEALARDDAEAFLINPEAFKLVLDDLRDQDWDALIVDESSMLKNPKSQITQHMQSFGGRIQRRYIMTATPRPNTSLDFWGQMAFLDHCLGGNYKAFRDRYYYQGYDGYSWYPKSDDVDDRIWNIVSARSYRVRLEDCVDLPGETVEKMAVDLSPELSAHYQDMLQNMAIEIENAERDESGKLVDSEGKVIDTQWRVVQMNKLAQITSGYVYDNDGEVTFLDESPKIAATVDMAKRLIENEGRSVVIWVRFTKTEGRVIEEALKKYGVSTLHGGTKDVKSSVDAFKNGTNKVMVAHAQSAKFGHTWVKHCNVAIFHSYDYSWESFYQAKRRIYRMGQTRPVTYIINIARGTVDEEILAKVFMKEAASDAVVDGNVVARLRERFLSNQRRR